ncbi:MAG: potassium channel family protein [Candidatus Hydrothermarchaeaceae archaeon]
MGFYLTKLLVERKNEVALIEKDKNRSQDVSRQVDALVINGDGTQTKTLEEADIKNADVLVASTGKDEINLLACLLAKNMGVKTVISRVSDPEYKAVFKSLGLDFVISPEVTAAEYIEKLIRMPSIVDLAFLGRSDMEVLEFNLSANSKVAGKTVDEIRLDGFLIIAVYREDKLLIPSGKTLLSKDDKILVLAKTENAKEVEKLFSEVK